MTHRLLFRYHPVLGHSFIPGLRARVEHENGGYRVATNSCGFRADREYPAKRRPGSLRVLVFGDSFTAGDGVENGERYPELLETLLPGVELFNCAVSGTGTDQQYLTFREVAGALDPDLVLAAVYVENCSRNQERFHRWSTATGTPTFIAKPYFALAPDGSLSLQHVPVPARPLAAAALPPRDLLALYGMDRSAASPLAAYDSPDSSAWLLLRAILAHWAADAGVPLVVLPLPMAEHLDGTAAAAGYQARFAELMRQTGISVIDPLPALLRCSPEQRRAFRFPIDPHLTAAGHSALAAAVAPLLQPLIATLARGTAGGGEPAAAGRAG